MDGMIPYQKLWDISNNHIGDMKEKRKRAMEEKITRVMEKNGRNKRGKEIEGVRKKREVTRGSVAALVLVVV